MDWVAIGTIAEIVGAIAVVVSLIYVATQIRQNTQVSRSAARQAIADSMTAFNSDLVNSDAMAPLVARDIAGEELEPHETLRLYARAYMIFRTWDNIFYQSRLGMIEQDEWQGFRRNLSVMLHVRHIRDYWRVQGDMFSDAFREEVQRILEEIQDLPSASMVEGLIRPAEGVMSEAQRRWAG